MNIPCFESRCSLSPKTYKPRLRAVSTRKNRIKRRKMTTARAVQTNFDIRFRLESGQRKILNKTVRSEKLSKETVEKMKIYSGALCTE